MSPYSMTAMLRKARVAMAEAQNQEREMNTDDRRLRDEDMADAFNVRLAYHQPRNGTNTAQEHEAMRGAARQMAATIISLTPRSRARSLALTAVEEAMHWGNSAIAISEGMPVPESTRGESQVESQFASRALEEQFAKLNYERPEYLDALAFAGDLQPGPTRFVGAEKAAPPDELAELLKDYTLAEIRQALTLLGGETERGGGVTALAPTEPNAPADEAPIPRKKAVGLKMLTEDPEMALRVLCPYCDREQFEALNISAVTCLGCEKVFDVVIP